MTEWTASAKAELERYFDRVRPGYATAGADAAEVEEDLRRHIDEEIAAAGLKAVTEEDVRRILARIGTPESDPVRSDTLKLKEDCTSRPANRSPLRLALLVFGVVLPTLSLGLELATHMCAGAFFDPIPSWWQVLLVGFVPLANLLAWQAVREGNPTHRKLLAWANGGALGIALFFSLLFVPLMIPAFFAVAFFGWGLLPMSPLFSLIAALRLRHHLRRLGAEETAPLLPGLWRGAALGFAAALVLHLPTSLTQIGLHLAASDSSKTRARGVQLIRRLGSDEALLRECYGRTRWAGNLDLISWLLASDDPVSAADPRNTYYRVTGRAFNSVPPPTIFTARGRWNVLEEEFTWDIDQGGESVAGRVKGLSLASSRQDGFVDADAALAYVEWTLEFKNFSTLQREARAQIHLPPGGVVSRLTLWINGEEREAAFGGRSQVREAYRNVVTQRRDPVLVTTCGPDRVLMQCFPVPPNGGLMKVRIGITASLGLTQDDAAFHWPCFLERNFTIADELKHQLWLESKSPTSLRGGNLKIEVSPAGTSVVRGSLTESGLGDPENVVLAPRTPGARQAWVMDSRDETRRFIRQTIQELNATRPSRVVFVVDASAGMDAHYPAVAAALTNLPDGLEFAVLVANDGPDLAQSTMKPSVAENRRQAADVLTTIRTVGGQDNVPALTRAWDLAADGTNGIVVWIHGPQPVLLDDAAALQQRFERRPDSPALHEIQTAVGPNRITEKLDGIAAVKSVPRRGSLRGDLDRLIQSWSSAAKSVELVRERLEAGVSGDSLNGKQTSSHLARLWARDEIQRLVAARKLDQALELARRYQLVTPVSGAVVLETKAQYQAAGLQPVDATTVPAVPEPSTWVLLFLGAVVWVCAARHRNIRGNPNATSR